MAKVESLIKVRGKVGDATFRILDGVNIVQLGCGPSGARVKHDPAFERSRENSKEFEGASRAGEMVRRGLGDLVRRAKRKKLAPDLVKVCSRWQLAVRMPDAPLHEQQEKRGQRSVPLSRMHSELVLLKSDGCPLEHNGNQVAFRGKAPRHATHVQATLRFFTVSDIAYDSAMGKHLPVHAQRTVTVESEVSVLRKGSNVVIVPHLDRVAPEECGICHEREAWLCAVLVEFLEVREGVALPIEDGCGWVVVKVATEGKVEKPQHESGGETPAMQNVPRKRSTEEVPFDIDTPLALAAHLAVPLCRDLPPSGQSKSQRYWALHSRTGLRNFCTG